MRLDQNTASIGQHPLLREWWSECLGWDQEEEINAAQSEEDYERHKSRHEIYNVDCPPTVDIFNGSN